jgi:type I restriction enzyme S subunit
MMTGDWQNIELGDFIELKRGYDLPKRIRMQGDIPVVSSAGHTDTHNCIKVKGPGVITGRYGTIGQVYYIEEDFWPLNTTLYVKDFKGNDPLFVNYLLQTISYEDYSDKAAVPGINRNHLHKAKIRVPVDTQLQNAIAAKLWSLEKKVQLNRQINKTLEQMAQALFKSWFIDFDPVIDNALAAGNEIPGALLIKAAQRKKVLVVGNVQQLPNDICHLFPSEFSTKNTPCGWQERTFESLVNLIGGGTPKTSVEEYWNGQIPWFSVVDAPNDCDVFVTNTDKHVTQLGVEKSSTKILRIGTTIISARGTVGKCALVASPMAMNQSCYGLNPKQGIADEYIYYLTRYQVSDLQKRSHGSVFDTITRSTFTSIELAFPGPALSQAFAIRIRPLLNKVLLNNNQISELTKLRDTLLPKLISGELKIPEAQAQVEAALA